MTVRDARRPLSDEELERWDRDGLLCVEGLFTDDQIDSALRAIFACFRKYAPELAAFESDGPPHRSDAFHAGMRTLRRDAPEVFSKIYDTMQTNALINAQASGPGVLAIVGQLFGDPPETLARSDTVMRMDPPDDERNLVGWHQDRTSRPHNDSGFNGIVFLMPLQDTTRESGALKVCPGSHKEGFVNGELLDSPDAYGSQVYSLPEERLAKYEAEQISATVGDGIFLSFNLFHASAVNTSERIRFTMGMRFQRAMADDFHPGALVFQTAT